MRTLFSKKSVLLILFLCSLGGYAHAWPKKEKVTREVHKTFYAKADGFVYIQNKYGDVRVTSWDEDQVVFDIEITVEGTSKSKIEAKLEEIDIEFDASPDRIRAITHIETSWKNTFFFASNYIDFEINYTVKLPKNSKVHLINDYGTISLNELYGQAEIDCDYGKLIVGALYADGNSIKLDYTRNSTIDYIKSGVIDADYSDFEVGESENIRLQADYTDAQFGHVAALEFDNDYGKITVDSAQKIIGTGDYVTCRFGTIESQLDLDADYGSLKILHLKAGFKSVRFNTDYTAIQLGIDSQAAFSFEVDMDYGGFSAEQPLIFEKEITKNSVYRYYQGYHLAKGAGHVQIEADYGSIKLKSINN